MNNITIVTVTIVAISTANVEHRAPSFFINLLYTVILLAIVAPNVLIGFLLSQHHESGAIIDGMGLGMLVGLVVLVPVGFFTFIVVMSVFYGAGI